MEGKGTGRYSLDLEPNLPIMPSNFDLLRAVMTPEMASRLISSVNAHNACLCCIHGYDAECDGQCQDGIVKWLNLESNEKTDKAIKWLKGE